MDLNSKLAKLKTVKDDTEFKSELTDIANELAIELALVRDEEELVKFAKYRDLLACVVTSDEHTKAYLKCINEMLYSFARQKREFFAEEYAYNLALSRNWYSILNVVNTCPDLPPSELAAELNTSVIDACDILDRMCNVEILLRYVESTKTTNSIYCEFYKLTPIGLKVYKRLIEHNKKLWWK